MHQDRETQLLTFMKRVGISAETADAFAERHNITRAVAAAILRTAKTREEADETVAAMKNA